MTRFWVSWFVGSKGKTSEPPFQYWITEAPVYEYKHKKYMGANRYFAVLDAEKSEDILPAIRKHFPRSILRLLEEKPSDFKPSDRFPFHDRTQLIDMHQEGK